MQSPYSQAMQVNDDVLAHAFQKYPSFQRARVVRDKNSGKTYYYNSKTKVSTYEKPPGFK